MKINKVFVYGTLMSGMANHYLIKPFIESVKPGKAVGALFDLPYGYPAMISGNGVVVGEVMELRNIKEALIVLDQLEDYYGAENPDNLYHRVIQEVEVLGGDKVSAYLYLWAKPAELEQLGTLVPDGDWKKFKDFEYQG